MRAKGGEEERLSCSYNFIYKNTGCVKKHNFLKFKCNQIFTFTHLRACDSFSKSNIVWTIFNSFFDF